MRIVELTAVQARIPLRRRVAHASFSRDETDSLLIRCRLEDGTVGWGEGLPRPYVTGETIETCWQHVREFPFAGLAAPWETLADVLELASGIALPRPPPARDCFGNAARCALELAVLDAGCRAVGVPLSRVTWEYAKSAPLRAAVDPVFYSGAVTGARPATQRLHCGLYRLLGFRQCKVKVGFAGASDEQLLRRARRWLGPRMDLRIDANEAWSPESLFERCRRLEGFRVSSIEQPVPHERVGELGPLRNRLSIPIMLDESLCSLSDGERAIDRGLCDAFNLRLSKCGGFLPTLQLARLARDAGLSFQLGCQVGETGILSAAGRHFATSVQPLSAIEGSFDRLLVREPLTREDLTFGPRGRAAALPGPGLGIAVDEAAVRRVMVRSEAFAVS